jgi:hypothetical protein
MIAAAPALTNLFLSLAALTGLVLLHGVITARGALDPINRRFLFGLRVTILLFAARALLVLTGVSAFGPLILLAASLIPLAVIILTEGLLRRHAPSPIKWLAGTGTVVFAIVALWPGTAGDPARLYSLLAFQIAGLSAAGSMVLTRDRTSLSAAENRAVGRLGLSLILLIPLAAADFLGDKIDLPIQVSGLAVLFLCWLAVSLGRQEAQHLGALSGLAIILAAAATASGLLLFLWSADHDAAIMAAAIVTAAMLTAAVASDARALRTEERSLSLLRTLAEPGTDALTFLRSLQSHPLVDGAVFIEGPALTDLNPAVLTVIFTADPVLRRADSPPVHAEEADHLAHLFARYDATHLFLVRTTPLLLVALSMPAVMASPRAELELRAVQRMAQLMAEGPHASV